MEKPSFYEYLVLSIKQDHMPLTSDYFLLKVLYVLSYQEEEIYTRFNFDEIYQVHCICEAHVGSFKDAYAYLKDYLEHHTSQEDHVISEHTHINVGDMVHEILQNPSLGIQSMEDHIKPIL